MKLYNIFVIFVVIYILKVNGKVTFSPSIVKQARKLQTYCQKQTNISNDLLIKTRSNIFENDRTVQCFLHCMLDMTGIINSQNEISLEPLMQIVPEELHESLMNMDKLCGTQAGADSCEISYNTVLCYLKHNTENYELIL